MLQVQPQKGKKKKNELEIHAVVVYACKKVFNMVGGVTSQLCSEKIQKMYVPFFII